MVADQGYLRKINFMSRVSNRKSAEDKLKNPLWWLNNLYYVLNEQGQKVSFKLNFV